VQVGWYSMVRARELYERVREAQAMLGTGEVEEAVARAQTIHGPGATVGLVEQPGMPANPER